MAIEVRPARVPDGGPPAGGVLVVFVLVLGGVVALATVGRQPDLPTGIPAASAMASVEAAGPPSAPAPTAPAASVPALWLQAAGSSTTSMPNGAITWRHFRLPMGALLQPIVATAHGLVGLEPGTAGDDPRPILRSSADGQTWAGTRVPIRAVVGLRQAGDDVVVYGWREAARFTWSGAGWIETERLEMVDHGPTAPSSGPPIDWRPIDQVVFGARAAVIVMDGATVLTSVDGHTFRVADAPPDPVRLSGTSPLAGASPVPPFEGSCNPSGLRDDGSRGIGPVLATRAGFVAFTAGHGGDWGIRPVCEPVAWTSTDGRSWALVSGALLFGTGSWLQDVEERDGRYVAVGGVNAAGPSDPLAGRAAVWLSDDGTAWRAAVVPGAGRPLVAVAATNAGWLVIDEAGDAWTSVDGGAWQAAAVPHLLGVWGTPPDLSSSGALLALSGITRDDAGDWQNTLAIGIVAAGAPPTAD